ncbi:MAG TPA: glycosyltransferase family 4 protein [Rhodocyclaceae bacterium]|nr:glycosyltransferase family 4 protein [Rhodocyclaceae bacterium]
MSLCIVHTESSKGWGGQENRTLNELLCMRKLGHRVAVVCQPEARLGGRAREAGIEVFEVPMRGVLDIPAILSMRRIFKRLCADIVNTHSGRDTQLAGLAARTCGRRRPRIVRTRHLALPITSRVSYSILPDQVVAVSRYVAEYLVSAGVPRGQVVAVPTGIDLAPYQVDAGGNLRAELGLPADALLIGTVAILRKKKGHAELLEAAAQVLARYPDAHFVFAGDGPQMENLQRRIQELGVSQHVHLLGLRRDVINVLQSLDLFVLPTYQEALGTAFMEAGATSTPAIGTNVDGVPEVVRDGETGLLVPAKDANALAEAILTLLSDPVRRQAMGAAALAYVTAHYSRDVMAQGMLAVYEKLLAAR